ncbi:choline transporter-like protein 5 isoform X1 [Xiphophorus maculatus]|uniref:choline transporter-like protein 5 isoform X1 n=1 Tax=Xiphophorus maculatus TaxID=8083 RepID=UPI000293B169|nr:choline transporter-like protein 5 isoform X1 [Xiphophorus maculatus]
MARNTDTPSPYPYHGEPIKFDPNFRGPVQNRKCTDVVCCIIFLIVILGYIALGTVAWFHGDPRKIISPTDSQGQFCGQTDTSNSNKNILFYFNMLKCASPAVLINLQCPTTQLCVSKCPDRFATLSEVSVNKSWEYYRQFCKPGFVLGSKSVAEVIRDEDCPLMLVPSKPILQRCFPEFKSKEGLLTVANQTTFRDPRNNTWTVNDLRDAAMGIASLLNAKEIGVKILEDYANSWVWILIGLGMTMVFSLSFILLMRYIACVILWLMICGIIIAAGYGGWRCYKEYVLLLEKPDTNVAISDIGFQTDLSIYLEMSQTWLVLMILLILIVVVIVLMLIFLRKNLSIAFALMKEGSRAIFYIICTLFYPIVTFFLLAICIAYSAVTAVFLASSGNAIYKVTSPDDKCIHRNLTCSPKTFSQTNIAKECPGAQCMFAFYGGETVYHNYIILLHVCNLFVFLWLVNFVLALGKCTLAGAFASYYWAKRKPKDIPTCPVYASFSRAMRYHTGSLAFGSLLLAMVQMIRIVLENLHLKLKRSQSCMSRFLLHCLKCCFWCLERFIKFLNTNAYIMIAIYGHSFCKSSRDAFDLLMRNILRVVVLDNLITFLLFIGKLVISGGIGVLAFLFFSKRIPIVQDMVPQLNFNWVPLLTLIIGSFMISSGFFNVYAMCVDTLFLCFLCDLEVNNGTPSKPYHMTPNLMKIFQKRMIVETLERPSTPLRVVTRRRR